MYNELTNNTTYDFTFDWISNNKKKQIQIVEV